MRHPLRRACSEAGFTLVETLIGVSILGIGVVAVVGGMATSIKTADIGRSSAEARLAVGAFAEALATTDYDDTCPTTYSTGYTAPTGYTAGYTVAYWDAVAKTFTTPCGTDSGLQRVKLTVTSNDGRATEALIVAKRTRPEDAP